jgi:hypothetical protein
MRIPSMYSAEVASVQTFLQSKRGSAPRSAGN